MDGAVSFDQYQPRKRRQHTRSRNGCKACKKRHVRCDEVKPICNNCLVRGGECCYLELESSSSAGLMQSGSSRGSPSSSHSLSFSRLLPANPADPFESLPIAMTLKSHILFNHFANYRVFARTLIAKNPNATCVGIILEDPQMFRAALILAAMHYAWINGSLQDMEETFLYHKGEAMRYIHDTITNPTEDSKAICVNLIAVLAFAEGGLGNTAASEAHLGGLFTLLDMRHPEKWHSRLYGMLQRVILVAGGFVAAARNSIDYDSSSDEEDRPSIQNPHFSRGTGSAFNRVPYIATRLSPFFYTTPPDMEACNSDLESEVIITALRRLSRMPPIGRGAGGGGTGTEAAVDGSCLTLSEELTSVILSDTETYIATLLFKPQLPLPRQPQPKPVVFDLDESHPDQSATPSSHNGSSSTSSSSHKGGSSTSSSTTPSSRQLLPTRSFSSSATRRRHSGKPDCRGPYASLHPSVAPSSSRAWAVAAYLYAHLVLDFLWGPSLGDAEVDPDLLRWMLYVLREDVARTEEAMRIGADSNEMWLWKVVVGAYALTTVERGALAGREEEENDGCEFKAAAMEEGGWTEHEVADLQAWFAGRLRSWSRAARVKSWDKARHALEEIVWLDDFRDEKIVRGLWENAITDFGA